jgi:hypothetical protein
LLEFAALSRLVSCMLPPLPERAIVDSGYYAAFRQPSCPACRERLQPSQ